MVPSSRSPGYAFILEARPDLAFDLEQLSGIKLRSDNPKSPLLVDYGSIDEIAIELEIAGSGNATKIRTDALRALGLRLQREYSLASDAIAWLGQIDFMLGVWSACACARDALRFVPEGEERPRLAIEASERWVLGVASYNEVSAARKDVRIAVAYAPSISAANAALSAAAASGDGSLRRAADNASAASAIFRGASKTWEEAISEEQLRLVGVIADALPGLPVRYRP